MQIKTYIQTAIEQQPILAMIPCKDLKEYEKGVDQLIFNQRNECSQLKLQQFAAAARVDHEFNLLREQIPRGSILIRLPEVEYYILTSNALEGGNPGRQGGMWQGEIFELIAQTNYSCDIASNYIERVWNNFSESLYRPIALESISQ